MENSILESIGVEIIGVMSPVSICMFLVVLLVYALTPTAPNSLPIRTAANLVYLETPTDSTTQKLEGALLNAVVFIILIAAVTFVLVLLYYYNFNNFLKNYMRFSAFFVLGSMGGSIFLSIIQHFSIPIDSITCLILLFNFTIVGVLSVFSPGIPILLRQGYMVLLGIIVAAWFTKLPEWTTWTLLVALALYDLVAVLAPGGPLKLLVELAQSREEELPALIYEARPTVDRSNGRGSLGILITGATSRAGSVELQPVTQNNEGNQIRISPENHSNSDYSVGEIGNLQANEIEDEEMSPLVGNFGQRPSSSNGSSEFSAINVGPLRARNLGNEDSEIVEEGSPLIDVIGLGNGRERRRNVGGGGGGSEITAGIKLGLGDFVFYSVLVGRAAMYDLMTVYACYLAIISGLGCTLILLSVCHRALPALPISITLGVIFYFCTRLVMEPFVVGTSTNLMMF
ncbi:Peptidase A22A [Macleaya cordata]|uniref:Presenilin n=1 Tax=Macleaya cordata TaxID=56857 RepID=A0A200Q6A7_MACCD|nr:Peptidase A22A [Macleaya cordata]